MLSKIQSEFYLTTASKVETPTRTRITRHGKRKLEDAKDASDNKKTGRKKQRREENLDDYSFDQECEKSATEFMKRRFDVFEAGYNKNNVFEFVHL